MRPIRRIAGIALVCAGTGLLLGATVAPAGALELPPVSVAPVSLTPLEVDPEPIVVGPVAVDVGVGTEDGVAVDADAGVDLGAEAPIGPITIDLGVGANDEGLTGDVNVGTGTPPVNAAPDPVPAPAGSNERLPAAWSRAGTASGAPTPDAPPPLEVVSPGAAATAHRPLGSVEEINVSGEINDSANGFWSNIGHVTGRFGPWFALVGLAFIVQLVARSALRDRQRRAFT
jgi:hypothetical protein